MRRILLAATALSAVNGCAVTGPWQLASQRAGIDLYLQEHPDSGIPEFKGVVTIESSMQEVMSVLTDFGSWPNWVYRCQHAEIVRTVGYTEAYVYQITDMPLVSDRDVVLHGTTIVDDSGDEITIQVDAAPQYCDHNDIGVCRSGSRPRLVRVRQLTGSFHLKRLSADRVEVTWQQHMDPGGGIPDWITRMMLERIPMRSLERLKQLIEQG